MQFLAPLFFVALAGLAIPVLLHLTQREKKQIVRFPSLMFVRRIPYQSVRRRKIHNWLLLMVRLAALALIILAFARPLHRRQTTCRRRLAPARAKWWCCSTPATAWASAIAGTRAQAAARDADREADRVGPRLGRAVLARAPTSSCGRPLRRSRLQAAVDSATPSPAPAHAVRARAQGGRQHSGRIDAAAARGRAHQRLPARRLARRGRCAAAAGHDAHAGACSGRRGQAEPQRDRRVARAVDLLRSGARRRDGRHHEPDRAAGRRAASITLEVGGLTIGTKPLQLKPGSSTSVTFDAGHGQRHATCARTVKLADDALAADNAFNFVVSPTEPVRITVVDRGNAASALYLTRALSIGDAPKFETVVRQADALSDDDLRRSAVVVLNDVEVEPAARPGGLPRYVEQGGGLFVAAGPRAQLAAGRRSAAGDDRAASRSHARRRRARRRARVRASGVRAVPRAAQRRLLVGPGLRLSQPHRRAGMRRCWRVSTRARPRCSSGASDAAACCSGPRRSTCRGATCRPSRCSCRSFIGRCVIWRATPSRSRGSRSARCSMRPRSRRAGRRRSVSC